MSVVFGDSVAGFRVWHGASLTCGTDIDTMCPQYDSHI